MDKRDIIDGLAKRSGGGGNFGLGGQAAAEFYRETSPSAETLLYMLAVAVNDIALLKEQLARVKA